MIFDIAEGIVIIFPARFNVISGLFHPDKYSYQNVNDSKVKLVPESFPGIRC